MKNVLERVETVTELLKSSFQAPVRLLKLEIANNSPATGAFKLRVFFTESIIIDIYEYLKNGYTHKYSYSLIIEEHCVLRYDNAPHHKEISTYPHHKHINERITELYSPDIRSFISEVKMFLKDRV